MQNEQPTRIVTGKVLLSYVNVFEPKMAPGSTKAKYSVQIIVDKTDKFTIGNLKRAIDAAIKDGVTQKWKGSKPANLKLPVRDGDIERPDDPVYKGKYFFNASSVQRPGVVGPDPREALTDTTEMYSGCFGKVSVNFYAFDTNGNRGVAAGLGNVQKLTDGPALGGGRANPEDEFSAEAPQEHGGEDMPF